MAFRFRLRDARLIALVLVCLAIAGGALVEGLTTLPPGGWRKIDRRALDERLGDGRLTRHEAEWYHAAPEPLP